MEQKDVVDIGGGPAGLAAAVELHKQGIRNMIILEREAMLGGILRQCIHDEFRSGPLGESLSGPEYAQAFIDKVNKREIPLRDQRHGAEPDGDRVVTASTRSGLRQYHGQRLWCFPWAQGAQPRRTGHSRRSVRRACSPQAPRRLKMNLYNRMPGKEGSSSSAPAISA